MISTSPLLAAWRFVAPVARLIARRVRGRWWSEIEEISDDEGPDVRLRADADVQRPADGAGPLNHRRYGVEIVNPRVSAEDLLRHFRIQPNRFSPTDFATFRSDESGTAVSLSAGEEVTVSLPGPWDGPVVVAVVEPNRLRLETLDGHMEAGWIEFRATELTNPDRLWFEIESMARSGDIVFDALYHPLRIGRLVQSEMWINVLEAAAQQSGGTIEGVPTISTTIYRAADQ